MRTLVSSMGEESILGRIRWSLPGCVPFLTSHTSHSLQHLELESLSKLRLLELYCEPKRCDEMD